MIQVQYSSKLSNCFKYRSVNKNKDYMRVYFVSRISNNATKQISQNGSGHFRNTIVPK